MVQVARDQLLAALPDATLRQRGSEVFARILVVIPREDRGPQAAVQGRSLPPCQQEWATKVVAQIRCLVLPSHDEEKASLMQRTLTGTLAHPGRPPPAAVAINAELAEMPERQARTAASELLRRLRQGQSRMEGTVMEWEQIEAALVAHSSASCEPPDGECCPDRIGRWVSQWARKLAPRGEQPGSGAASSHEAPPARDPHLDAEDEGLLYEDRAQEEERQAQADEELYRWHTQQAAREAQLEDRAAVAAHMGWATQSRPKWHLDIEVQAGAARQTVTVPLKEGAPAHIVINTRRTVETSYLFQGQPVAPEQARKRLAEATEAYAATEASRAEPRRRTAFSTSDPELRPFYQMWERGAIGWEQLVEQIGAEAAEFVRVAAEIDSADLETPVLPATQMYDSQTVENVGGVHPDSVSTVPLETAELSDASTTLFEPASCAPFGDQ